KVVNNHATGGQGSAGSHARRGDPRDQATDGRAGGAAEGGGLYVGGGTANLSGVTLSGNTATGGAGGPGGDGLPTSPNAGNGGAGGAAEGAGLYVGGGSLTLTGGALTGNTATGGQGGAGGRRWSGGTKGKAGSTGQAEGGGLYISDALSVAAVSLDSATVKAT